MKLTILGLLLAFLAGSPPLLRWATPTTMSMYSHMAQRAKRAAVPVLRPQRMTLRVTLALAPGLSHLRPSVRPLQRPGPPSTPTPITPRLPPDRILSPLPLSAT